MKTKKKILTSTLMIPTQTGKQSPDDLTAKRPSKYEGRLLFNNTPGGTRTPNLGVRSALLYPIELLERIQASGL